MEFTLQAFVVTGVSSARSSPPLRGIFPPRGELPSREASSPANILAGTTQTNKVLCGGKGKSRPTGCLWGGCVGYNNPQGKISVLPPCTKIHPRPSFQPTKNPECSPVRTTHSQNKSYPPILMKRSTPYPRVYLKKAKISSISTNAAGFCVKEPWNPQRIPRLFALNPVCVCGISVIFFAFINQNRDQPCTSKACG